MQFDVRTTEGATTLIHVVQYINTWALKYQAIARKLIKRIAASNCACCNAIEPHHRDKNTAVANPLQSWNELVNGMRDIAL